MLKMARTVTLGEYEFEGTPSRDSLRYISIFGIEGVKTLVRGLYKHKVLFIDTHNTHTYTHIRTHGHTHARMHAHILPPYIGQDAGYFLVLSQKL